MMGDVDSDGGVFDVGDDVDCVDDLCLEVNGGKMFSVGTRQIFHVW